ncbi:hypothetical protein CC2G_004687 [Coprinopsis cinerea AmutBmut pab1-1]|nr:hypothetical protein CC2G_004687 [Coprinopsis cinerea AmutBmut pab1-1]
MSICPELAIFRSLNFNLPHRHPRLRPGSLLSPRFFSFDVVLRAESHCYLPYNAVQCLGVTDITGNCFEFDGQDKALQRSRCRCRVNTYQARISSIDRQT